MEKQADAWLCRNVNFHAASAGAAGAPAPNGLSIDFTTLYRLISTTWRGWLRAFAIAHP